MMTARAFDELLSKTEAALNRYGSCSAVQRPGSELELLTYVGESRDLMLDLVRRGDRQHLIAIFGDACTRISRLQAVLDTVELTEMNGRDQRLTTCVNACTSVEKVLEDLGLGTALREARTRERLALATRLHLSHVQELKNLCDSALIDPVSESAVGFARECGSVADSIGCISSGAPESDMENMFAAMEIKSTAESCSTIANIDELLDDQSTSNADNDEFDCEIKDDQARPAHAYDVGGTRSHSELSVEFGYGSQHEHRPAAPVAECNTKLRIDVISASHLGIPDYRVGDFTRQGACSLPSSPYVELDLADNRSATKSGVLINVQPSSDSVASSCPTSWQFTNERHFLAYCEQPTLRVRVRNRQRMQAMLREDPLIGVGSLPLDLTRLLDGKVRRAEIPLVSTVGRPAGTVSLRCRLLL